MSEKTTATENIIDTQKENIETKKTQEKQVENKTKEIVEDQKITKKENIQEIKQEDGTKKQKVNIIDELIKKQIISKDQVEVALKEQKNTGNKEDIASILVRMGFISDKTLSEILNANTDTPKLLIIFPFIHIKTSQKFLYIK